MFADADIAAIYDLECHAHALDAEQHCLEAGLGVSMHTIRRVTTPEPDQDLPWAAEDQYSLEIARRESCSAAPLGEGVVAEHADEQPRLAL